MKTTPFTHFHEELGARMAPFAGYNMPIEYTGIKDEHNTCLLYTSPSPRDRG